jgi:signal transduction histidine kinase/DNA-binding response OmpR family regulator
MPVDILAVDDNEQNLKSISLLLADLGANVIAARSGNDALLKLLEHDFALILLDVQMPGLDGFETANLIRLRDRNRHTPIIFVTAFDRTEQALLQGYARGAVDFLFKPIVPEILRSKVSFFLELYRKTEEARRQAEMLRAVERREHERRLEEARQKYERALLDEEMQRERKVAEALKLRADQLSQLLEENQHAQKVLKHNNERLKLLADIAGELLSHVDPEAQIPELLARVTTHLELEAHLVYRSDASGALVLQAAHGVRPTEALRQLDPASISAGRPEVIDSASLPPGDPLAGTGLVWIHAPVATPQRVLGAILCGTHRPRTLGTEEISLVQLFASQVAAALDRAQLIFELRDSDRRKDEFLAMLGHELRNPLAPIRNSLELFRLRGKGSEDEIFHRALAATERQVAHMTRLVDDLLDVSRITRGKVQLRKAPVDLSTVVEQAVHASEHLIRQRQHELVVKLPDGPVVLDADANRLTQVFGNLLQNAAKYTEPGGHIALEVIRDGAALISRVTDDGIGLKPERIAHIFEPFVQEDPSTDRSLGGLGLGLTLVKSLVEMHGGTVDAYSEGPGKGSRFEVRLPLTDALEAVLPAAKLAPADGPRPLTILLAEDNPDIRSTMRDLLELNGHRVFEAADGVHAVELALAERPRVALVDIGLPGFDGYRVAELLRAAAGMADTRLVAVTGYGTEDARQRAKAAGFDAHLVKPIALDDLNRILQQLT